MKSGGRYVIRDGKRVRVEATRERVREPAGQAQSLPPEPQTVPETETAPEPAGKGKRKGETP